MRRIGIAVAAFILIGGAFALPHAAFAEAPGVCQPTNGLSDLVSNFGCYPLASKTVNGGQVYAPTQSSAAGCDQYVGSQSGVACRYTTGTGQTATRYYTDNGGLVNSREITSYDSAGNSIGTPQTVTVVGTGDSVHFEAPAPDLLSATANNQTVQQTAALASACAVPTAAGFAGTFALLASLVTNPLCLTETVASAAGIVTFLANILFIAILAGFAFSFDMLVSGMGSLINGSAQTGIVTAWQMIRDLVNIGIIGGMIAVAIGTILQVEKYAANKLLPRLIIAAVLVNFSYFFAGAIIDSSNYLAVQMYNNVVCTSTTDCSSKTVADRFEALRTTANRSWVNIGELALPGAAYADQGLRNESIANMIQAVGVLICLLIAIFVFLSAFALLVGRFVVLVFLLISSPLGIAGSAIPGLSGNKFIQEWWSTLLSQAFFAPVFFLLVGFALRIAQSVSTAFQSQTTGQTLASSLGGLMAYIIGATFLLLALRISKQMSAAGGEWTAGIYKGADKLSGWMPKAYTGTLKYLGSAATTNTVGALGDRAARGYEKWASQRTLFGKTLANVPVIGALDRTAQKGLNAIADAKFGGTQGYRGTLAAIESRAARLGDVKVAKEAIDKAKGYSDNYEETEKETKGFISAVAESKKTEDAVAMRLFGKKFVDLSDEQKKEVMADAEWINKHKELDALAKERHGKRWDELTDKEKEGLTKKMTERGRWRGRLWTQDENTKQWGWESDYAYEDRLRRKVDLRDQKPVQEARERDRKAAGYDAMTKDQQEKWDDEWTEKDQRNWSTHQGAIDEMRTNMSEVSLEVLKEEYQRNPKILPNIATALSKDQYLSILGDKTVSRAIRNEMREKRLGGIMETMREFEDRVVEPDDWDDLPPEERVGKVIRGSAEYDEFRGKIHEQLKKYVDADELVEYVESSRGKDVVSAEKKQNIRQNRVFNDACTNGVYRKIQESRKISNGEKRDMRGLKRGRLLDAAKLDDSATSDFNELGIATEEDRAAARNSASKPETLPDGTVKYGAALSYEEYKTELAAIEQQHGKDSLEAKRFKAGWKRARAETAAEKYFKGKSSQEIDTETRQESFGHRLAGKYMRREQLIASKSKDQTWRDQQATAMAIYGTDDDVRWLRYNDNGGDYNVDWDEANRKRTELGLPPLDAIEEKVRPKGSDEKTPPPAPSERPGIAPDEPEAPAETTQRAVEQNAQAAAPIRPENPQPSPVNEAETAIRRVIEGGAPAQEGSSIESLRSDPAVSAVAEVVDSMSLDAVERLAVQSQDIFENPRVAAALDERHAMRVLNSDISSKTRRALIDNLIRYNGNPAVRQLLWEKFYDSLTPEQKVTLKSEAEASGWKMA